MKFAKKSIALGMAALMAASLAACAGSDTTWAAKSGEMTVPAGVYIGQLMNEYYTVTGTMGEDVKNPLKEQVDGVSASQKITTEAKSDLNEYIAIEKKFDELGLTLTAEDQMVIEQNVEGYWQYIGQAYQDNGISKESYAKMFGNDAKRAQIFQSIYGEGGTEAVPEQELKDKFTTDFAKIIVMPLTFSEDEDAAKKESDNKATREMIDKYYKLAKDGGNMEDLVYEAKKEATKDETLEKPEVGMSYSFIGRDSSPYDQKMTDAVFAAKNGEPTVVETETSIYLFVRYDISENESDFTSRKSSLVSLLKQEEFDGRVVEWANALTDVTYNDASIKRYTPEKLKMN